MNNNTEKYTEKYKILINRNNKQYMINNIKYKLL